MFFVVIMVNASSLSYPPPLVEITECTPTNWKMRSSSPTIIYQPGDFIRTKSPTSLWTYALIEGISQKPLFDNPLILHSSNMHDQTIEFPELPFLQQTYYSAIPLTSLYPSLFSSIESAPQAEYFLLKENPAWIEKIWSASPSSEREALLESIFLRFHRTCPQEDSVYQELLAHLYKATNKNYKLAAKIAQQLALH